MPRIALAVLCLGWATAHGCHQQGASSGPSAATGREIRLATWNLEWFFDHRFDFEFGGDDRYKDLSKHLRITASVEGHTLEIVTVHLVTSPADRLRQARTLREWTESLDGENVVILGDFNLGVRFRETAANTDIGLLRGLETPTPADDLFDAHAELSATDRRTTPVTTSRTSPGSSPPAMSPSTKRGSQASPTRSRAWTRTCWRCRKSRTSRSSPTAGVTASSSCRAATATLNRTWRSW